MRTYRLRPLVAALGAALLVSSHPARAAEPPPAADMAMSRDTAGRSSTLQESLALALARDPQVQGAQYLLQAVQAQGRQVRSRWWPRIAASTTNGRSSDIESGTTVERLTQRADLAVRMNLFNGLADRAQLDAIEIEQAAAELELRRTREDAAERVAVAYSDALRLDALIYRSNWRLGEVRRLGDNVKRQTQAGKASVADTQLAEASMLDAQVTHDNLLAERRTAQARLEALAGAPVGALVPVPVLNPALFSPGDRPAPLAVELLWERARDANAAWRSASERARAAVKRLGIVAPGLLPKLDVEVRHRLYERTSPLPNPYEQRGWSVVVSYDIPLGGETFAQRDEGRFRAQAAQTEADRLGLTLRLDLDASVQRVTTATNAAPLLRRQADQLAEVVKASEVQYEAGRRSLQQLIELRNSYYSAEFRYAENAMTFATATLRQLAISGALLPALGMAEPPAAPTH